jgi:hypothetical protein
MSGRSRAGAFLRALRLLIPEADLNIIHERPWHSLTFGGTQICIAVSMTTAEATCGSPLSALLTEHEFCLPRQIVADIAVTQAVVADGAHCLMIDALLLEND